MNPKLLATSFLGLLMCLCHADEAVHIIGPLADGSPAAPAQPAPRLDVAPQDVLETRVHPLGDHQVILQKISPVDLPASPEPAALEHHAARAEVAPNPPAPQAPSRVLLLSATVYHSTAWNGQPRTCFRWRSADNRHEFTAWSNTDGHWLEGFTGFETASTRYSLLLFASSVDADQGTAPAIPGLPTGDPAFVVSDGSPSAEDLAPLTALHQLLKSDGETLRLAWQGREAARLAREAALAANPPPKPDIVLHYWRVPKPIAPSSEGDGTENNGTEGGDR